MLRTRAILRLPRHLRGVLERLAFPDDVIVTENWMLISFCERRGLRAMDGAGIFALMNTTLEIDETLLAEARKLVGRRQQSVLVRMGLEALIEREAARRLAALGGTMPTLETPRRQRSAPAAR